MQVPQNLSTKDRSTDIQADAFTQDRGPKTNKEGITPQEDSYHAEKYQLLPIDQLIPF